MFNVHFSTQKVDIQKNKHRNKEKIMKEITIEQGKINKINDCLDVVETAIDKEAYTKVGVKLRETCGHFASMVLDAFILPHFVEDICRRIHLRFSSWLTICCDICRS